MGRTNPSATNNTAAFSQLQAENDALKKENRDLRQKLERMNERLLNAQRARFGSSGEKQDYVMPNQVGIFNEAEVGAGSKGAGAYGKNDPRADTYPQAEADDGRAGCRSSGKGDPYHPAGGRTHL